MNSPQTATARGSQRSFTALWIAGDLYALGGWILLVALVTWVYQYEESAFQVSLLLLAQLAPPFLLGLVGRPLVDRRNSQMAALAAHLLTALPLFSLLGLKTGDTVQFVLTVAFLAAIPVAFVRISHGELLAALIPPDHLAAADKALAGTRILTMILGPALGVMLLRYAGFSTAIGATLVLLLVSTALMLLVKPPPTSSAPSAGTRYSTPSLGSLRHGLRRAFGTPGLRTVAGIRAWTALIAGGLLVPQVAFVVWGITLPADNIGLILASQGMGVLLGSIAYNRIQDRFSSNTAAAGALGLVAASIFGLGISDSLTAAACFAGLIGAGNVALVLSFTSIVHRLAPADGRGSVAAALDSLADGMVILSVLALGPLTDALRPRYTLVLMGILLAVLALYSFGAVEDSRPAVDESPDDPREVSSGEQTKVGVPGG